MNIHAILSAIPCLGSLTLAFPPLIAHAETPLGEASFWWQMSDTSNAAASKGHLKVHGAVQLGVPLEGSEQAASLARGGDGKAARFDGGWGGNSVLRQPSLSAKSGLSNRPTKATSRRTRTRSGSLTRALQRTIP